jgi:hypothetical protein
VTGAGQVPEGALRVGVAQVGRQGQHHRRHINADAKPVQLGGDGDGDGEMRNWQMQHIHDGLARPHLKSAE